MSSAVDKLLTILDLEPLEHNLFRGRSPDDGWQRVFGGQVIGQALVAASHTVDPSREAHSLHGYFMRPGDPSVPIIYEVDRIRDGRSFCTRRVVAIQHGKAIFTMAASYHKKEPGLEHQIDMPDVPMPEDLPNERELVEAFMAKAPDNIKAYFRKERPIELRPVNMEHYTSNKKFKPIQNIWVKVNGDLPDDPAIHRCALAYLSDMTLLDTSLFVHGRSVFNKDVAPASLDHAMWFHSDFRADEWLLYSQDSPSTSGARGFNRGSLYTRDGKLIASAVQEGLIRIIDQED